MAPLATLRRALGHAHKIRVDYTREDGQTSSRVLWPLGLIFWGNAWTLGAWCELRDDFRTFRLDRIRHLEELDSAFDASRGRTLRDYLAAVRDDCADS